MVFRYTFGVNEQLIICNNQVQYVDRLCCARKGNIGVNDQAYIWTTGINKLRYKLF
jgi:hypothetical protein